MLKTSEKYLLNRLTHLKCLSLGTLSVSVYLISIFLMFLASTIYHAMQNDSPHKYVMRIIDHSMIFLAIAGTYTPVLHCMINCRC